MTTTAAPAMETYTVTGFIEYPSTSVLYSWVTTRPSSTARSTSSTTSHGKGGVSVTLLALVLVGVGLLALAMAAWSRWAFLTRNALVRERLLAEEWARDGERRAKREALAKMIPPKLVEVGLGLLGGKEMEDGGLSLDLKSTRKLPLSLDYLPSSTPSSPRLSSRIAQEPTSSLQLSVLILPPIPPPSFTPTPNPDADDDAEEDLPEIQLGTTPITLSVTSTVNQESWDEILKTLADEKKRKKKKTSKVDASSVGELVVEVEAGDVVPMGIEREYESNGAWWMRRR